MESCDPARPRSAAPAAAALVLAPPFDKLLDIAEEMQPRAARLAALKAAVVEAAMAWDDARTMYRSTTEEALHDAVDALRAAIALLTPSDAGPEQTVAGLDAAATEARVYSLEAELSQAKAREAGHATVWNDMISKTRRLVQLRDAGVKFSKAVREKAGSMEARAESMTSYGPYVLMAGDMYDFEVACDEFDALLELENPMGGMEDRCGCAIAVDEPVPR